MSAWTARAALVGIIAGMMYGAYVALPDVPPQRLVVTITVN